MKKEIFLVSEKYERIIINRKRRFQPAKVIGKTAEERFDWLTVMEAAELFEADAENIREDLRILRRKNNEDNEPIH